MRSPPVTVIHADWSKDERKRICAVANIGPDGARITHIGPFHTLFPDLKCLWQASPTVIGFDFPLGVPAHYGQRLAFSSFPDFLFNLDEAAFQKLGRPAERADEICVEKPFYPARPGGTKKFHLLDAHGAQAQDLMRLCDRATADRPAACCLFWTLGANQVGRAAIGGWDFLRKLKAHGELALWPFDGAVHDLVNRAPLTVVETYPADAYHQIGLRIPRRWSKRRQEDRLLLAEDLLGFCTGRKLDICPDVAALISDGFGAEATGEDYFDALTGLLGMLEVLEGRRPEGVCDDEGIKTWEGWIFGQKPAIP